MSPATQYWDANIMVSSSVQLLQDMRALVGWGAANSYLGPKGAIALNQLTPFNDQPVPVLKLLAPRAHVKLAQLSSPHCLHDVSHCGTYGFTASVWLRLTPTGSAATSAVSLVGAQALAVNYSAAGGLGVTVQYPTGRPFWSVSSVQLPAARFVNVAICWSLPAGLAVYVNGTLAGSVQQSSTFRSPGASSSTSELVLGDANADARPVAIELFNFAYWNASFAASAVPNTMGLDADKASLIAGASDFWTFYGIYSALQPQLPAGYGKGLSKTPDRTSRGFGVLTDASTNSYVVLATAAQALSGGGALGAGALGLLQPDTCAAGVSFSFYAKFVRGLQGYLFSSGGELAGSTGFAVTLDDRQLKITASSNRTLAIAMYSLDASVFGTWVKLAVYWQPPGAFTSVQLGGKTPYSQACPLLLCCSSCRSLSSDCTAPHRICTLRIC